MDNLAAWFSLSQVEGLGCRRLKRLYDRFGTVEAVWNTSLVEIARLPTFHLGLAQMIFDARRHLFSCMEQLSVLREQGVNVICIEEPAYPDRLRQIQDPPVVFAYRGRVSALNQPAVAVVGTRSPTRAGRDAVREIIPTLVRRGMSVVSGLAVGVDQAAHNEALLQGGKTIAVLGQSLDRLVPSSLAEKIQRHGGVLAEHLQPTQASAANLVRRNRLISGLVPLVLVIEGERGASHTARFARSQGRQVALYRTSSQYYSGLDGVTHLGSNSVALQVEEICEQIDLSNGMSCSESSDLLLPFPCNKK